MENIVSVINGPHIGKRFLITGHSDLHINGKFLGRSYRGKLILSSGKPAKYSRYIESECLELVNLLKP